MQRQQLVKHLGSLVGGGGGFAFVAVGPKFYGDTGSIRKRNKIRTKYLNLGLANLKLVTTNTRGGCTRYIVLLWARGKDAFLVVRSSSVICRYRFKCLFFLNQLFQNNLFHLLCMFFARLGWTKLPVPLNCCEAFNNFLQNFQLKAMLQLQI